MAGDDVDVGPMSVEGSLSVFFGDRYDLSFTASYPYMLGLEGNLTVFTHGEFRLGILHGVAAGFIAKQGEYDDQWSRILLPDLSVGCFIQHHGFFTGFRYTYGTMVDFQRPRPGEFTEKSTTHFVTASIGFTILFDRLRVMPEIGFLFGDWRHRTIEGHTYQSQYWVFIPSVTFALTYGRQ